MAGHLAPPNSSGGSQWEILIKPTDALTRDEVEMLVSTAVDCDIPDLKSCGVIGIFNDESSASPALARKQLGIPGLEGGEGGGGVKGKGSPSTKRRSPLSFRKKSTRTKKAAAAAAAAAAAQNVRSRRWRIFVTELEAYKRLMEACASVHV